MTRRAPLVPSAASGTDEPQLRHVTLWLCELCLSGAGGECHTPGCALWMKSAPDLPVHDYENAKPPCAPLVPLLVCVVLAVWPLTWLAGWGLG